ncbi:RNA processing protein [Tulasnella sp. 427]|nr:RNA processing protein [Tulasnella sp. 427]
MLPLTLLNAAQNRPMLVELKNGETYNGHLVNCDNFMNITLREVYQTSPEGDRFWKLKEVYVRGSTIKYLRVPDALLDVVKEEQTRVREAVRGARGGAAPRGGRGGAPARGDPPEVALLIEAAGDGDEDEEPKSTTYRSLLFDSSEIQHPLITV